MKGRNRIKLALDILMLIVLLLMYHKNVLGLGFHEIGGIALCGLFIIHKLLNGKWILVVTGKLFSRKAAFRSKLNWLIDFLLLICFIIILVSGLNISKVLFSGTRGASVQKTMHYAISALALVLTGIHLGLHYQWLSARTGAHKLPLFLRRAAAIVLSVMILGFGVYQITATDFLHWIDGLGAVISTGQPLPDGSADGNTAAHTEETSTELSTGGHGSGPRDGTGKGLGNGSGASDLTEVDISALPQVLLGFLSITLSFSVIVAWTDGLYCLRKRSKRIRKAQAA